MNDFDDSSLEEIEKKVSEQFEAIELQTDDEFLKAVKPKLRKKHKFSTRTFMTRFVAAATSFILLFGIGLAVWLTLPENSDAPPDYRYEDLDIEARPCEEKDITEYPELYLPDLDILVNTKYTIGEHKESLEKIYLIIEGIYIDNGIMRNIYLKIILREKYHAPKEEQYTTDNKIIVSGNEISVLEDESDPPFYNFKLGFKKEIVRYYIDYQTTSSENDIISFMKLFLK